MNILIKILAQSLIPAIFIAGLIKIEEAYIGIDGTGLSVGCVTTLMVLIPVIWYLEE